MPVTPRRHNRGMELFLALVTLVAGLVAGALIAVSASRRRRDTSRALVNEIRRTAADERQAAVKAAVDQVLAGNRAVMETERARSTEELDGKKSLIDQQLEAMTGELGKVGELVQELERDRANKFGQLTSQLQLQSEGLAALTETTQSLRQALSSTKARGQWGERMAEDVLRLAGLLENVNYRKQRAIDGGGVPDFTFFLPQGQSLHMDVKFPLDNYLRFLEAASDLERERYRKDFLKDVRQRLKELTTRDYVDPGRGTVDCVLLFIPNEQVYAFIQEQDRALLDDALRNKVVFCSPLTLYAVLAVVRQAVDNFRLEQTSKEILTLLNGFAKQWEKFVEQMDKVGRSLTTAGNAFGELEHTRRRMLERELDKIEALRHQQEISLAEEPAPDPLALEA